jgi:hypothetical protein
MSRTRIHLTDKQRTERCNIYKKQERKQHEIIHVAKDRLISESEQKRKQMALEEASGIWRDREDLLDFSGMRSQWDRR